MGMGGRLENKKTPITHVPYFRIALTFVHV